MGPRLVLQNLNFEDNHILTQRNKAYIQILSNFFCYKAIMVQFWLIAIYVYIYLNLLFFIVAQPHGNVFIVLAWVGHQLLEAESGQLGAGHSRGQRLLGQGHHRGPGPQHVHALRNELVSKIKTRLHSRKRANMRIIFADNCSKCELFQYSSEKILVGPISSTIKGAKNKVGINNDAVNVPLLDKIHHSSSGWNAVGIHNCFLHSCHKLLIFEYDNR